MDSVAELEQKEPNAQRHQALNVTDASTVPGRWQGTNPRDTHPVSQPASSVGYMSHIPKGIIGQDARIVKCERRCSMSTIHSFASEGPAVFTCAQYQSLRIYCTIPAEFELDTKCHLVYNITKSAPAFRRVPGHRHKDAGPRSARRSGGPLAPPPGRRVNFYSAGDSIIYRAAVFIDGGYLAKIPRGRQSLWNAVDERIELTPEFLEPVLRSR